MRSKALSGSLLVMEVRADELRRRLERGVVVGDAVEVLVLRFRPSRIWRTRPRWARRLDLLEAAREGAVLLEVA
jgi:hypothetical protein